MGEDLIDGGGFGDQRDHRPAPSAAGTAEQIDLDDLPSLWVGANRQLGPNGLRTDRFVEAKKVAERALDFHLLRLPSGLADGRHVPRSGFACKLSMQLIDAMGFDKDDDALWKTRVL